MIFLICDIDTLEAVNVSWQCCFVNVSFAGLNDLNEGVVNEDVLLLGLDQMRPLSPVTSSSHVCTNPEYTKSKNFPRNLLFDPCLMEFHSRIKTD